MQSKHYAVWTAWSFGVALILLSNAGMIDARIGWGGLHGTVRSATGVESASVAISETQSIGLRRRVCETSDNGNAVAVPRQRIFPILFDPRTTPIRSGRDAASRPAR